MNKIVNINLGGYPFTIDDDAFNHLNAYLNSIKKHFKQSEGCDEIVSDIEIRIAELFKEKSKEGQIVSMPLVSEVIQTMGKPEEFGGEPETSHTGSHAQKGDDEGLNFKPGKRLFRNPDDKVLAGVCSGLSAYFGIQDPVWIRALVALAFFAGGTGFIPYFILWIIVPEAKTSADKLAMKGEPINASNIAKTIENEVDNLKQRFNEFEEDFNSNYSQGKKKGGNQSKNTKSGGKHLVGSFFSFLGRIIKGISSIIGKFGRTIVLFFTGILIFIFIVVWIAVIGSIVIYYPYQSFFTSSSLTGLLALVSLVMVIGIPFLFVVQLLFRLGGFRTRSSFQMNMALGSLWFLCLTTLAVFGGKTVADFSEEMTIEDQINFDYSGDTLFLNANRRIEGPAMTFNNIHLKNKQIQSEMVYLNIKKSDSNNFKLKQYKISRGNTVGEAESRAKEIDNKLEANGNKITFDRLFVLDKGSKWRAQEVRYDLFIPENKIVVFDNQVPGMIRAPRAMLGRSAYHLKNKTVQMKKESLICLNCPED